MTITFTPGSVIPSTWLNDLNTVAYTNFGNGVSYTGNLTLASGKSINLVSGNVTLTPGVFTAQGDTSGFSHRNTAGTSTLFLGSVFGWTGSGSTTQAAIGANGTLLNLFAGNSITNPVTIASGGILTVPTSVVTPLITTSGAGVALQLGSNGASYWTIDTLAALRPATAQDNAIDFGSPTARIAHVFAPIIDTGTTGSLSLKTNNGAAQVSVVHIANTVNVLNLQGAQAGFSPAIYGSGEAGVGFQISTLGTGNIGFNTSSSLIQFQVLHTASATRNITVTGSNGGNPTLGVTSGSLAITPAVVIAGASLQIGTNPASAASVIGIPYSTGLAGRKSDNTTDIEIVGISTKNSVVNVVTIGTSQTSGTSAGVVLKGRSGGAAPTTSDLGSGEWTVWRDTGGATTKLYYNNAGTIQSVALA